MFDHVTNPPLDQASRVGRWARLRGVSPLVWAITQLVVVSALVLAIYVLLNALAMVVAPSLSLMLLEQMGSVEGLSSQAAFAAWFGPVAFAAYLLGRLAWWVCERLVGLAGRTLNRIKADLGLSRAGDSPAQSAPDSAEPATPTARKAPSTTKARAKKSRAKKVAAEGAA